MYITAELLLKRIRPSFRRRSITVINFLFILTILDFRSPIRMIGVFLILFTAMEIQYITLYSIQSMMAVSLVSVLMMLLVDQSKWAVLALLRMWFPPGVYLLGTVLMMSVLYRNLWYATHWFTSNNSMRTITQLLLNMSLGISPCQKIISSLCQSLSLLLLVKVKGPDN
jgi:hypothetical protein